MGRRRIQCCRIGMLLVLASVGLVPGLSAQPAPPGPRLAGFWDEWLAKTEPLLAEEERLYFLVLEDDSARERFLAGLWQSRGAEALERWARNSENADRLRSRSAARTAAVRAIGKPASIETFGRCGPLRRLEVWEWEPEQLRAQGGQVSSSHYAVFVEATSLSMGSFEPWEPGDLDRLLRGHSRHTDVSGLIEGLESERCYSGGALARLRRGLANASSLIDLESTVPWPSPGAAWLRELATGGPERRSPARLELEFTGSYARYTILHGRIRVPVDRLEELGPGQLLDRISVVGDVFEGSRLLDTFSITHHIAGAPSGEEIAVDFYRRLPPGRQQLHLRVADRNGIALFRDDLALDVPEMTERAPEPAGSAGGLERLTRSDQVLLNTLPSVELLPQTLGGSGRARVRAITTGGPIAAVEFRLGGDRLEVDREPPYSVELAVVTTPTVLTAHALDPEGRELTSDSRRLEPPRRAFSVGFGAPRTGRDEVEVSVGLPLGAQVARFECRRRGRLTRTALDEPYSCPYPRSGIARMDYLTVRIELESGEALEDVLFLGPQAPEEVDVRLAELNVSILDAAGRPASDLGLADLRIWEEGSERRLLRVQPVDSLPLNLTVLMDLSSSMGRSLKVAARSAQDFFESVIEEDDAASLLGFNHDFHRLAPFSGDADRLRYGAAGLSAWGSTRLHDAMVHALFQFTGRPQRRALIVLSDGSDVGSDFPIEQVADFAVQAGVNVFPISLGFVPEGGASALGALARRSGGRAFRVAAAGDLPRVYRQIEHELRARYLLVFEPGGRPGSVPAPVEVEVLRQGYQARDVRREAR